ncbi:MAG: DUF4342 domain-containing protein [Deinococcales bacterium]
MSDHDTRHEGTQQQAHHGDSFTEEFKVSGEAVVAKIKELVREGNVRRIIIKNEEGSTLIEIPLTIGVIGTVLLPVWAAIGAIAALAANLTIAVERRGATPGAAPDTAGAPPASGSQDSGTPQLPR